MSRTGEKVDLLQMSLYVLPERIGPTVEAFRSLGAHQSGLVNGRTKGIREDLWLGYEILVVCRIEEVTVNAICGHAGHPDL